MEEEKQEDLSGYLSEDYGIPSTVESSAPPPKEGMDELEESEDSVGGFPGALNKVINVPVSLFKQMFQAKVGW